MITCDDKPINLELGFYKELPEKLYTDTGNYNSMFAVRKWKDGVSVGSRANLFMTLSEEIQVDDVGKVSEIPVKHKIELMQIQAILT
jgi:hypothetical protein